ncbi:hypothetical protein DH2020_047238 [Rehmannia glutinosa]|uniref:PPM-type phosphatase domain-containing protein n=1 Tax=Rehmannia glutinosa TaxID=99300 RepID=A0ABR0U9T9_REHGL
MVFDASRPSFSRYLILNSQNPVILRGLTSSLVFTASSWFPGLVLVEVVHYGTFIINVERVGEFIFDQENEKSKNKTGNCDGREAVEAMAKNAKKNELILRTSGIVNVDRSNNLASVFSKRGQKGVNQDCFIVWEEFGCQEDMMFCGIFDGHGPWGHFVAKRVRESMPSSLLCNWQETLAEASLDPDIDMESDNKKLHRFNIWKHSYLKTCAAVDQELEQHRGIEAFHSGTTALTIVRQPGIHRVWLPNEESPGLAMSRAFGDYCVKDFGLISVPEVTQRHITSQDQFVVLATDGVWDVISNQEAVRIVSSTPDRAKSAKRLVECAARAWKRKRKGIAMDDISAIVLFLHSTNPLCEQAHLLPTPD